MVNPDKLYQLSREALLLYEDARLNSLLQGMPNFYAVRNDQSLWGNILRALALELAKMEYFLSYDLVAKQPEFLTPPDIKRRWAEPLAISATYPANSQFDSGDMTGAVEVPAYPVGYKDMLVKLLEAYRQGATTQAIAEVIYAYTGLQIVVEELYKSIGNGIYDQSDRNAIKVAVSVGTTDSLNDINSLQQLQQVVRSLYGAIDLAKPAHVGLEFTTIFGTGEEVSDLIAEISDTLRIIVRQVEQPPFDPMLYQAPLKDLNNPKTTIAAYGRKMKPTLFASEWEALPTKPSNAPVASPFLFQAYYFDPLQNLYVLGLTTWASTTNFYANQRIVDSNGNIQFTAQGGTSAASAPTWANTTGGTTPDGTVTWVYEGKSTLTDPSKWIQVTRGNTPTGEVANWDAKHPMGLVAPRINKVWEISEDIYNGYEMD